MLDQTRYAPASDEAGFSSLDTMLRPRSVAVIGASDEPSRIGGRPIAYMRERGFAGSILPVNPRRATVQGLRAFPDIASLPEVPDAAVIAVPSAAAGPTMEELGRLGCRAAIMFSAGFAEASEEGAVAQAALLATVRRHGMRLLGPNCIGLFNAAEGYYPIFSTAFEHGWPLPGRIGIASQSGAYGTHLFAAARDRGMGTGVLMTTGNEADVSLGDAIGWLAQSPEIDVVMAYAEGFRESGKLLSALDLARRVRKPVIMMKVGRSAVGGEAARSHTASIAGDDAVMDAVLAEFGAIRARSTEELLDIAYAATKRIYPANNTLGVVTVSGGAGVLISDAAEAAGLPMPPLPEPVQARLKAELPFCATRNPVDMTAQVFNDLNLLGTFADATVEGGYTSILAFLTMTGTSRSLAPGLRAQLKAVKERNPGRLWAVSLLGPAERIREYEEDGFLCFEDPARAVTALQAMGRLGQAFEQTTQPLPSSLPPLPRLGATPNEAAAKALLDQAGIAVVREAACSDAEAAVEAAERIGYPVVLKILSPDILHKSEIGGVLLDIRDAQAVRTGVRTLLDRAARHAPEARIEGVLVAQQIQGAVECILGVHRDPVFGPVAMVGLGGVFVEVLRDVAFHRCPVDVATAERMIRRLRGAPLLTGARNRPRADVTSLAEMLSRLSVFAIASGPALRSTEINPVLVLPEGQGCLAADAVIEVDAPESESGSVELCSS